MSAEVYAFPEGQVYLWTGSATASAVIAFAENTTLSLSWGWENRPTLGGAYNDHLTGIRGDVTIGAMYTYNATIAKIAQSATAIHLKLHQSGINGSAGYLLYSGRIDSLQNAGTLANPYRYTLAAHFNIWSAYGGG